MLKSVFVKKSTMLYLLMEINFRLHLKEFYIYLKRKPTGKKKKKKINESEKVHAYSLAYFWLLHYSRINTPLLQDLNHKAKFQWWVCQIIYVYELLQVILVHTGMTLVSLEHFIFRNFIILNLTPLFAGSVMLNITFKSCLVYQ